VVLLSVRLLLFEECCITNVLHVTDDDNLRGNSDLGCHDVESNMEQSAASDCDTECTNEWSEQINVFS
jgi:hypothetical protein